MIEWVKGLVFKPSDGPCVGHWVEVVNPGTMLVWVRPEITKHLGEDGNITQTQSVERSVELCVLVRCRECLRSWHFPIRAELSPEMLVFTPSEEA